MANNGRYSCTGNSRHTNIRHLFVKDRVEKREIDFKYCPTHLMIAEYFTKPLQGKMFKKFRDLIMGYVHINDLLQEIEFSAKDCVEKSKIVTINSITHNRKRRYNNVCKASKNKDVK